MGLLAEEGVWAVDLADCGVEPYDEGVGELSVLTARQLGSVGEIYLGEISREGTESVVEVGGRRVDDEVYLPRLIERVEAFGIGTEAERGERDIVFDAGLKINVGGIVAQVDGDPCYFGNVGGEGERPVLIDGDGLDVDSDTAEGVGLGLENDGAPLIALGVPLYDGRGR